MDLKEATGNTINPYRCYIKGQNQSSDGDNVYTIGFKNGLAVVQTLHTVSMKSTKTPMVIKQSDAPPLDPTNVRRVIVKVDPATGKKYIMKDGKRIEVIPKPKTDTPSIKPRDFALEGPSAKKVNENPKYLVYSMNVTKPGASRTVATMTPKKTTAEKPVQTQCAPTVTQSTQTEPGEPDLCAYILNDLNNDPMISNSVGPPPGAEARTKEDLDKFNFFVDMRNALKFDRGGNLPIHDSVLQNNIGSVKKNCIMLKAIRESVNIPNQQDYSPLHLAILHNANLEIVKALLSQGASLALPDPHGNNAIHLAIEHNRLSHLNTLLSVASQANFNLDECNHDGYTPLIVACVQEACSAARLLLHHGADPNVRDKKSGRTALFHACEAANENLVELLMSYRADTKIRNFFGTSSHDAMFEIDDVPMKIKLAVLGKDKNPINGKIVVKKRPEATQKETKAKKAKLETTPIFKRISEKEFTFSRK